MKKLHNKSILVIDDDAGMLSALDKVLTSEGADVICAPWAGDALEILTARDRKVDLVITDLKMPMLTGLTVVYSVHKVFPALPVIVLTAFGSPAVRAECMSQGASAFLEKPLDTPELLTAIDGVLSSQKADRGRAQQN
jgi:two-component system response regulator HydG